MKDPLNRTKVVIRHLPPSLSRTAFFEQINSRFSSRYNWSNFRSGKSSYKNQKHARAYMNFNTPDDVFEFAEFFNGHVFVNEKGAQFKAVVEYAPSQRVPKLNIKKDGREGTIYKDPEYMEFLEHVSKPAENLPSADIQLERRETERAGIQEAPIVTPLMEFVRKRRAAKSGNQHVLGSDVKAGGRSRTASPGKSRSSRHASEKYILKSTGKNTAAKNKSTHILVPQRENQMDASGNKSGDTDSGNGSVDTTKKRILLLKGKEQEISQVSDGTAQLKTAISPSEASPPPGVLRLNQRHDASGRIIRSILLNKDARQTQSPSSIQMEQKLQALNPEKGKRPPCPVSIRSSGPGSTNEQSMNSDYVGRRSAEDKSLGNESHGFGSGHEKQDRRRTRSRERLDRGVWTPLRRAAAHATNEYQTNLTDSYEGKRGDKVDNSHTGRGSEVAAPAGGRNSSYADNGPNRHFGRRGPSHGPKEDGSSRRGGSTGHGLHEKQVWVQKSASGS